MSNDEGEMQNRCSFADASGLSQSGHEPYPHRIPGVSAKARYMPQWTLQANDDVYAATALKDLGFPMVICIIFMVYIGYYVASLRPQKGQAHPRFLNRGQTFDS